MRRERITLIRVSAGANPRRFSVRMRAVLLFVVALIGATSPQELPENDDDGFVFNIPPDEVFYDNKVLPDEQEVTVFLYRNETRRFFFLVDQGRKPIAITVTPCSSAIDWRIYFRYQTLQPENRKKSDDPLVQQRDLLLRPKRSKRLLQAFSGNEMMTYMSRDYRLGLFIVEVTARDRHTNVRLLATSTAESDPGYPELPSAPTVDIIQRDEEAVTLAWKASPSEHKWGQLVEYCVAYNTRKNYRTLCALEADREGEMPPPVPKHAGFGFSWEKPKAKQVTRMRKAMRHQPDVFRDIQYECVGRRTWFTINSLLPGTQYFVDVFVLIKTNNRSSAYKGTSFVTEGKGQPVILRENKVMLVSLRHLQGTSATFQYTPEAKGRHVVLDILPCFGQLTVEVVRSDESVLTRVVRNLYKFSLQNVTAEDTFRIKVNGDRKQTQSLKIFVTRRPKKDPFPQVTDGDARLKVIEQLTTCNSATFTWTAPDEKSLYCLYRRKEGNGVKRLFAKTDICSPGDVAKRNEKVFCRRYRRSSRRRHPAASPTVQETVGSLRPKTNYIFELQVTRRKGETFTYESARVTTREKC